jgi:hypothetical protein
MMHRFIYGNGNVATLTDAQRQSLNVVATRFGLPETVTVIPEFRSEAVLLEVNSDVSGYMIICVEPDGYAHT